jgi:pre-mRNA-processing factor 40
MLTDRLQRLKRDISPPRERTPRRDGRLRTRSPQAVAPPAPVPPKEEPAGVHSGSEEGEIEED